MTALGRGVPLRLQMGETIQALLDDDLLVSRLSLAAPDAGR